MSDPAVAKLHDWLKAHEQDLLNDTLAMLRIPSVETDAEPNAPFGKANRDALDLALGIAEKWGMATKDLEGHCGYAEFGSGERLIMSLGHLDVVPVGSGWKHDPWGAEIDGDYIYGRGTTDDKGPTMASFYAARAIQECFPEINARIRQVFGCDEESGFECVKRYMKTEEPPTFGVAPDSGYPLIHAEKGIANLTVSFKPQAGEFEILEIVGGQRPNIVIDACNAKVRVTGASRKHVEDKLGDQWDRNLTAKWNGDVLEIEALGKACHGAFPVGGDNAAMRTFRFLLEIAPVEFQTILEELFLTGHISGVGLGIHGRDDVSKDLTSNLGIVTTENGRIHCLHNIRYPVTWKGAELRAMAEKHFETLVGDWKIESMSDSPSLYFPLDHPLVKAICDVVQIETGETKEPGVMGGGTYARAVPNTVSIGTGWEGDGNAHETDERLKVEHLFKMSRIYAHILYRLATMPA